MNFPPPGPPTGHPPSAARVAHPDLGTRGLRDPSQPAAPPSRPRAPRAPTRPVTCLGSVRQVVAAAREVAEFPPAEAQDARVARLLQGPIEAPHGGLGRQSTQFKFWLF